MPEHNFVDTTVQLYFTEETRAKFKQIKETRRRGPPAETIDWNRIWERLELAAQLRDQGIRSVLEGCNRTPREVLDRLRKLREKIDDLLQELEDPRLIDWSFYIEDQTRWLIRGESPRLRHPVIKTLATYRDEKLAPEIEQLDEFTQGRRTRAQTVQDCDDLFLATLIEIGHELFGPEIGDEKSPLLEFVSLAAEPVMGSSTPERGALRSRARRQAGQL
jgi:hypothetical protein